MFLPDLQRLPPTAAHPGELVTSALCSAERWYGSAPARLLTESGQGADRFDIRPAQTCAPHIVCARPGTGCAGFQTSLHKP
jgi:hypothetical protein